MKTLEEGLEETAMAFGKAIQHMPPEDSQYSQYVLGLLLKGFHSDGADSGKGLFEKDLEIIDCLLAAYKAGDRPAITETVTGGWVYNHARERQLLGFEAWNIFHNETIANHLNQIGRNHLRFNTLFEYARPTVFFEGLEKLASDCSELAVQIKSDIFANLEFKSCYDAWASGAVAREAVREKYLDEEFKRKDQVTELLGELQSFYKTTSLFVERILEAS